MVTESERATGLKRGRVRGFESSGWLRQFPRVVVWFVLVCGSRWGLRGAELPSGAHPRHLDARRGFSSSLPAAFQNFGRTASQMQKLGIRLVYKTTFVLFFSFFFLFRFPTALPSWDLATSFPTLQLFILTTRAAPWRIGLKQTTTAISLFLSSPTSLFVFFVFSGRFFERITGLQQKQLQQIPCGLRM